MKTLRGDIKNEVIAKLSRWFNRRQNIARAEGVPLNQSQIKLAVKVGISNPHNIRILYTDTMPQIKSPMLMKLLSDSDFQFSDATGLCLGYGIYILKESKHDRSILAHELTHTKQYENLKGASGFIKEYLEQFLAYGYQDMPLEKEARKNEKL